MILCLICGLFSAESALAQAPERQGWQGIIGKNIPVSVWLEINNDLIIDEIVYTNTKRQIPIRLLGTTNEHYLYLCEMLPDGRITATIWGCAHDGVINGQWVAPAKIIEKGSTYEFIDGKSFPIHLTPASAPTKAYTWKVAPSLIEGIYSYSYGDNAASGVLEVNKTNNDSYEIYIITHIGAPPFNLAELSSTELTNQDQPDAPNKQPLKLLQDNRLVVEQDETCAINIRFFPDFASVQYVDEKRCANHFGRGASLEGIFLKTANNNLASK